MKKLLLLIILSLSTTVQGQIPPKPETPDAVHDLAGLFSARERAELNERLIAFSDTTSNRVVVVTVHDLGGMDASEFSFKLGESWGIGDAKFNNGVVIMVKPKTEDSYGEVFIAVGYGLEGVLPDAVASQIVNREMIPHFQQGDVYGGVEAAVNVVLPLIAGEYSAQEYTESEGDLAAAAITILVFILVFYLIGKFGKKNGGGSSGSTGGRRRGPTIITTPGFGGRSGGSFGGGGGFSGGFGGGSFGGGGAGGRW